MLLKLLNLGVVCAYGFSILGLLAQIRKLRAVKSAREIALADVACRGVASLIFLTKMLTTGDLYLIAGDLAICSVLVVYVGHILWYRRRQRHC